jgi:hypothetical protein
MAMQRGCGHQTRRRGRSGRQSPSKHQSRRVIGLGPGTGSGCPWHTSPSSCRSKLGGCRGPGRRLHGGHQRGLVLCPWGSSAAANGRPRRRHLGGVGALRRAASEVSTVRLLVLLPQQGERGGPYSAVRVSVSSWALVRHDVQLSRGSQWKQQGTRVVSDAVGEGEGRVVIEVMGESRIGVGLCGGGLRCYKARKLSRRS